MLQIESMSCYLRRVAGSETNYETFLLAFKENILRKKCAFSDKMLSYLESPVITEQFILLF